MNIKSMQLRSYRSFAVDEHVPPEAAERYRTLKAYERLRAARCNEVVALEQLGMSRRTLYRWRAALAAGGQRGLAPKSSRPRRVRCRSWQPKEVKAVMDMRRKYPFMGKARIQAMLARKGSRLSVSTVGRIIERALATGAIRRASFCNGLQLAGGSNPSGGAASRSGRSAGSTVTGPAGPGNWCNAL